MRLHRLIRRIAALAGAVLLAAPSLDVYAQSAGPTKIYFSSNRGAAPSTSQAHVWRMNPDGTQLEQVTFGNIADGAIAMSRDGATLAMHRSAPGGSALDIWMRDLRTGAETQLTNFGDAQSPTWSGDGTKVGFIRHGGPGRIWSVQVRPSLGTPALVTNGYTSQSSLWPNWSPDGASIVYGCEVGGFNPFAICRYNFGSNTNDLIVPRVGGEYLPFYSPDGTKIAWLSYRSSGGGDVYLTTSADPQNTQQIVPSTTGYGLGGWSPDGQRLLLLQSTSIATVNPDGTGLTQSYSGNLSGVVWAPAAPLLSSRMAMGGSSFGVKNDGTLWSWAANTYYTLGAPRSGSNQLPAQITSLSGVSAVSVSDATVAALKSDGTVWLWGTDGTNNYGQLGNGANTPSTVPVQASIAGVKQAEVANYHTLFLKTDGTVWATGRNLWGNLGDGTTANRNVPGQVPGLSGVVEIAAGALHSLALKSDGTVWAWGDNAYGQLGDGTTTQRNSPVQVAGLSGVTSISTLNNVITLALKADGTVWAWGYNASGQVGDGTTVNRSTPVQVAGLTQVVAIASGGAGGRALRADGTVWAWGSNTSGEVGDGTTTARTTPVQITSLSNIVAIGSQMALQNDGTVWAWGRNIESQLGDGTAINRLVPVRVGSVASGFLNLFGASISAPEVGLAPASLNFAAQGIGTSSASQAVTLTNTGTATLTISGITLGGTDTGDFGLGNNCGASLAAGTNCTINVTFTPGSTGAKSASVSIASNASGSPHAVNLAGSGGSTFTLSTSVSGGGSLTSNPAGINCGNDCSEVYADGTSVALTATPNSGYVFTGWGGACSGTGACVVTMSQARSVSASFVASAAASASKIYLTTNIGAAQGTTQYHVWRMNPDGTQMEQVTFGNVNDGLLSVSRDGSKLAFSRLQASGCRDLFVRDLRTGQETRITANFEVGAFDWSPDGAKLAFEVHVPQNPNNCAAGAVEASGRIWTVQVYPSLGTPVQLSPAGGRARTHPNWTPDSAYIYHGIETSSGVQGMARTAVATGVEEVLAGSGHYLPKLSPDGTKISWINYPASQVYVGLLSQFPGGGVQKTTGGDQQAIGWSPDSQKLLIVPGVNTLLKVLDVNDGTNTLTTVFAAGAYNWAAWAPLPPLRRVMAMGGSSFGVKNDGTLWSWAANTYYTLGAPRSGSNQLPAQITSLSGVSAVSVSDATVAALKSDGTVWLWGTDGTNNYGQLGNGANTPSTVPVQASIAGVKQAEVANYHTLFLKTDGTVWATGRNLWGNLGDGTTANRNVPGQVPGLSGVVEIAAGALHSLALKSDGTVWAWGDNAYGQLGDGTTTQRNSPVQVAGLSGVTSISTLNNVITLALKADGTVWAWGYNASGQVGDGTTVNRSTPVQVAGLTQVVAIASGGAGGRALRADGTVWAWGSNTSGEVGDGTTTARTTPVQITSLSNIVAIGSQMALQNDGTVWAWGRNIESQLGDGTAINRLVPVRVGSVASGFLNLFGDAGAAANTLTLSIVGAGRVTSSPAGIDCGLDCTQAFAANESVTLNAFPDASSNFTGWGGACAGTTGSACTLTMSESRSVTATFTSTGAATHTLSASVTGNGAITSNPAGISCGGDCTEAYVEGTSVTLTPAPNSGYVFTGWGGACSGTGACVAVMNQARSVTAAFAPSVSTTASKIYFISRRGAASGTAQQHLWRMNPDGTHREQVTFGDVVDGHAAVSSDGTRLAITRQVTTHGCSDLFIMDLRDRRVKRVTSTNRTGSATWSPDGTRIAFIHYDLQDPDNCNTGSVVGSARIWSLQVQPSLGVPVQVTSGYGGMSKLWPNWSPDGDSIAYGCETGQHPNPFSICRYKFSTNANEKLLAQNNNEYAPFFSADGMHIAWTSFRHATNGHGDAYVGQAINLDATQGRVTPSTGFSVAAWAPESTRLLLNSNPPPSSIYTIEANGSGQTQLLGPDSSDPNVWATAWGRNPRGAAVRGIAMGGASLVIKFDSTLWSWGSNANGTLGAPRTGSNLVPSPVTSLAGVDSVSASALASAALKTDGTAWLWGTNNYGQFGNGTTSSSATPVQASISGVAQVALGGGHTLFLKTDGTVWTTGRNASGELGDGSSSNRSAPVQVPGLAGVVGIAAGERHSLAVKADGTVWTWGANEFGQLGDGTTTNRTLPVQVSSVSEIVEVAASSEGRSSFARKADGTVRAWGFNASGQLGDGGTTNRTTAVQVAGISQVVALAAGVNRAFALRGDGTVWYWGDGNLAGSGAPALQLSPVQVPGLSGIGMIAAGPAGLLAIATSGAVYALGANANGELGDGTQVGRSSAVAVLGAGGAGLFNAYGDTFVAGSTLTVSVTGAGRIVSTQPGIDCGIDCVETYAADASVTLNAFADASSNFTGWGGACTGTTGTACTLTMSESRSAVANFVQPVLSVTRVGNGVVTATGINCGSDCSETYAGGQVVTLTATPDAGTGFSGWQGCAPLVGAAHQCNVTMSQSRAVTANFGTLAAASTLQKILLSSSRGAGAANQWHVWMVNADGTGLQQVTSGNVNDWDAKLHPDGKRIVFLRWPLSQTECRVVWTKNLQTGVETKLLASDYDPVANPAGMCTSDAAWSPDGTKLALARHALGAGIRTLWMANYNVGANTTDAPVQLAGHEIFNVSWHPDGNRILHGKKASGFNPIEGAVWDLNASSLAVTIPWVRGEYAPRYSPDGTKAAWVSYRHTEQGDVYVAPTNGAPWAPQSRITPSSGWGAPVWGPSSDKVVVPAGGNGLWVMNADGSNPAQILTGNNIDYPTWWGSIDPVTLLRGSIFAAGPGHSMAVASDGSLLVWGSNDNTYGSVLGDGTSISRATPYPHPILTSGIVSVAASQVFSNVLRSDGTVWGWGHNSYGSLGDGSNTHRTTPVQAIGLTNIVRVSAGGYHSLALKADGTLWSWGHNEHGQVGPNGSTYQNVPVQVPGVSGVLDISAGLMSSYFLKTDGTVWSWGRNYAGQLGDGGTASRNTPAQVPGLTGVIAFTALGESAHALKGDGTLWVWGRNHYAQLGDGTQVNRLSPVQIMTGVAEIARSGSSQTGAHGFALKGDGTVWAWGKNDTGSLGTASTDACNTIYDLAPVDCSLSPILVPGLSGVAHISAGGGHSFALKADGSVWAWGNNQSLQLGAPASDTCGGNINFGGAFISCARTPIQVFGPNGVGLLSLNSLFGTAQAVSVAVAGGGTVTSSPGGIACGALCAQQFGFGATVTLTAAANEEFTFTGWGGACSGTAVTCTMTMTQAKAVTASFAHASTLNAPLAANDPQYGAQWSLGAAGGTGGISAGGAWRVTTGDGTLAVAVVDSGVLPHADLAGRVLAGYDFVSNGQKANDGDGRDANAADPGDWVTSADASGAPFTGCEVRNSSWHGTALAGIIAAAANNATGMAGINWNSKMLPVRAIGKCGGEAADVIDAMRWAAGLAVAGAPANPNPARVINLSFSTPSATCSAEWQTAINDVRAAGAVVVVAAGNNGGASAGGYEPGNCTGVINVAAVNHGGGRTAYTNIGGAVTLAAPGGTAGIGILAPSDSGATAPIGDSIYSQFSGTSMAAAAVSGVASLVLSVKPTAAPDEVRAILVDSARPFPRDTAASGAVADCTVQDCGAGIVDAQAAVKLAAFKYARTSIAAGATHTAALYSDGTVKLWGLNATAPTPQPVSRIVAIEAGGVGRTIAARADGSVWAWDRFNAPQRVEGAFDATAVAIGEAHALALRGDGRVWAWGGNDYGQLGLGGDAGRASAVLVPGLANVIAIAAKGNHSLALKADGTVWAWGRNELGQLGTGSTANRDVPTQVSAVTGVTAISAGASHALALRSDGSVWSWGGNQFWQLGDRTAGFRATPAQVPGVSDVVMIAAANRFSMAQRRNGDAFSWGNGYWGALGAENEFSSHVPVRIEQASGFALLAGGDEHALGLKHEGALWGWGLQRAQVRAIVVGGDGQYVWPRLHAGENLGPHDAGAFMPHTDVVFASAQISNAVALTGIANGTAISVAGGSYSIDNAAFTTLAGTVNPGQSVRMQLTAGADFSVTSAASLTLGAQVSDFRVTTQRRDAWPGAYPIYSAQLNVTPGTSGVTSQSPVFQAFLPGLLVNAGTPVSISGGEYSFNLTDWSSAPGTVAVTTPGADVPIYLRGGASASGSTAAVVYVTVGGVTVPFNIVTAPAAVPAVTPRVALSHADLVGLRNDGRVIICRAMPCASGAGLLAPEAASDIVAVATMHRDNEWLVHRDGSVYGLRYNTGIAGYAAYPEFGLFNVVEAKASANFGAQSPGHLLMRRFDGSLLAQGANDRGQLGDGTRVSRTFSDQAGPVGERATLVAGITGVTAVSAGGQFSLVARGDGSAWAWGANDRGQLGDGTTEDRLQPVPVEGLGLVRSVAAGGAHALALLLDGTVWAWGDNAAGQLGIGAAGAQLVPVRVRRLQNIVAIAAGLNHSLALEADGTVWAWGANNLGQLGLGAASAANRKIPMRLRAVSGGFDIVAAADASALLKPDGTVWAWGAGVSVPAPVPGFELGPVDATQFARRTDLDQNVQVESNAIVLAGVGTSVPISVTEGEYSVNGGAYTAVAGSVSNGNTVKVRATTGTAKGHERTVALTIGTGTPHVRFFAARTKFGDEEPDAFDFTSLVDVAPGTQVTSAPVIVTGVDGPVPISVSGGEYQIGANPFTAATGTVNAGEQVTLRLTAPAAGAASTGTLNVGEGQASFSVVSAAAGSVPAVPATIAGGDVQGAALHVDGRLWLWGVDGSHSARQGLSGIASIAAGGGGRTIVARTDGTVWTWSGFAGPMRVLGISDVIRVAAGAGHYLALRGDNTVWAWGVNASGELGEATQSDRESPVQVQGLAGVIAIAARGTHSLALKGDGTVWSWGANGDAQLGLGDRTHRTLPQQVSLPVTAVSIAAGTFHSVARGADGTVWVWGANRWGQLGLGDDASDRLVPVQIPAIANAAEIAAGLGHTLMRRADGSVWAFGRNTQGQVGNGRRIDRTTPVQVIGLAEVTGIGAGEETSYARLADGSVLAWGRNDKAQAGRGVGAERHLAPVQVLRAGAGRLFLDNTPAEFSFQPRVEVEAGTPVESSESIVTGLTSPAQVTVAGGQMSVNGAPYSAAPVTVNAGDSVRMIVTAPAVAGGVGEATMNIGGLSQSFMVITQGAPSTPIQSSIGAGRGHTVALQSDGSVWSWGNNSDGQLGTGSSQSTSQPIAAPGLRSVTRIVVGGAHTLALKSDGTLWGWGRNNQGQLGLGDHRSRRSPVQVPGLTGIVGIAAGESHSLALRDAGGVKTIHAWGGNGQGQLGKGTIEHAATESPVALSALGNIVAIAAGRYHSLALRENGGSRTVLAWGDNESGQLGNGGTEDRGEPSEVSGLPGDVIAIAAGGSHSLALTSGGQVYAWGRNEHGQLGLGSLPANSDFIGASSVPRLVTGLAGVAQIAAGGEHSLARLASGAVKAWGLNKHRQLGIATAGQETASQYQPQDMAEVSNAIDIAAGNAHSVVLTAARDLHLRGDNEHGQAGSQAGNFKRVGAVLNLLRGDLRIAQVVSASLSSVGSGSTGASESFSMDGLLSAIEHGNVSLGQEAAKTLHVKNTANATVTLTAATVSEATNGSFTLHGNCLPMPRALQVGENCELTSRFAPSTASANAAATLSVLANAEGEVLRYRLKGTGTGAGGGAALTLSSQGLIFGNVNVNPATPPQMQVTLANSGAAALNITAIGLDPATDHYAVMPGCTGTLIAGAQCTLAVLFTPAAAGNLSGVVKIQTTEVGARYVSLAGIGVPANAPALAVSASALSFGRIAKGALSASQTLTLSNFGTGNLNFSAISMIGSHGPEFLTSAPSGAPCLYDSTLVGTGANCEISIRLHPAALGERSAALLIESNAAGSPHVVTLTGTGASMQRGDLSGDAKGDVVWRRDGTGDAYLWQLNGTTLVDHGPLFTVSDMNWKVAGVGDFDGDGKSDLFWRHEVTGDTYVWLMNGASIASAGAVFTVADLDWKVEGVTDFDGDGRADVLWRHASTGQVFIWLMNGNTITSSGSPYTVSDANWKIAALGDLDGDGKADVVWRRDGTGDNYAWLMNGLAIAGSGGLFAVADTNWKIVGAADTDGDGKADLLWRHAASGDNYWWKMNGLTVTTSSPMFAVTDLDWQIGGTGDYDGDGKADLFWRHATNGQTYVWLLDGAAFTATGSPATVTDLNWKVQNPK